MTEAPPARRVVTVISKAMLDMGESETLDDFRETMRLAVASRYELVAADWIWIAEVAPDTVTVSVETWSGADDFWIVSHFRHAWSIQNEKPVLAAASVSVEPLITYVPVEV